MGRPKKKTENAELRCPRLICSMTTLPNRCGHLRETIASIFEGHKVPDMVVLWICHDDFEFIPDDITKIQEEFSNFKVRWTDANYQSASKLIPALKEFPDDIIVNFDDDYSYAKDWLESLYNAWMKNRDSICTVAAHCIQIDPRCGLFYNRGTFRYNRFDTLVRERSKGYNLMFLSGHGTLYPPHCFDKSIVFDNDLRLKHFKTHDELWFWFNSLVAGVETVVCGDFCNIPGHGWTIRNFPAENALWKVNNGKEEGMLVTITNLVMQHNPKILKYFKIERAPVVHPGYYGIPGVDAVEKTPVQVPLVRSDASNRPFIPDGFDFKPTLKPAPVYDKPFDKIKWD